ncbi:hypothetical protein EN974_07710 [Mesorhizobium sp. M7A.F.Ca.CA.001.12.2.1]|nr:hypothetical protein EN974_07710 [Mesorhizobium sp. M7A.F.Ca.CA.001.12.2.1]RUZ30027.1 hypothetical protein EN949_02180 [Mesorhizobium sp. M7A.F.Ca.US.007.01.2.1]RUZ49591.1 hypothetical protein EN948_04170 [Mesorhizobium sp. M7A.F.Ca.US.003.02.1.1]
MEVVLRQSRGFTCAYFVLACSIAVVCAGAATGGQQGGGHGNGGHGSGGHGGGGGHDAGGNQGGSHKGTGDDPGGSSSSADDSETSTSGTTTAPGTVGSATATAVASARGGQSLDLPAALQPPGDSKTQSTVSRTEALPGVPDKVVRACHDAIESAAAPLGATSVRVTSAGFVHQLSRATISAPIEVSIDYARQGSVETRQAAIQCELDATGSVIGLT